MRRTPTSRLTFSDLSRVLSGIAVTTTVACAGTVTPPDSTPVYADEVAPGVDPIHVERQSTNRPDVEEVSVKEMAPEEEQPTSTPESPQLEKSSEGEAEEPAEAPQAESKSKVEEKSARPPADDPKAAPSKKSATPKKKAAPQKGEAEGGCGAGTCG